MIKVKFWYPEDPTDCWIREYDDHEAAGLDIEEACADGTQWRVL